MLTNHPSSLTVLSQPINMCWLNRKHLSIALSWRYSWPAPLLLRINIYGHFIEGDPVTGHLPKSLLISGLQAYSSERVVCRPEEHHPLGAFNGAIEIWYRQLSSFSDHVATMSFQCHEITKLFHKYVYTPFTRSLPLMVQYITQVRPFSCRARGNQRLKYSYSVLKLNHQYSHLPPVLTKFLIQGSPFVRFIDGRSPNYQTKFTRPTKLVRNIYSVFHMPSSFES